MMNKYKFYVLFFCLSFVLSQTTYSQWSAGASVSYLNLLVKNGYSNMGVSLKAEKNMLYFGLGYNGKVTGKRSVLADTAVIESSQAYAISTYSMSSFNLFLGVKNYFIGANDDNFGFYSLIDISYYYLPITKRIDGPIGQNRYYYHSLYGISKERESSFEEEKTSNLIVTGGVGLGIEKKIKEVYLYTDVTIKMTVTPPNSDSPAGEGSSSIFFPLVLNLGVRIPLDY